MPDSDSNRLKHDLAAQIQVFERLLGPTRRDPGGKNVHQLRVATRRVREVLWLIKKSNPELKFKSIEKSLQDLGELLGAARELDVALEDAQEFKLNGSPLAQNLKAARRSLSRQLRADSSKRWVKELLKAEKKIGRASAFECSGAYVALLQRIDACLLAPTPEDELHSVRITAKKLRYALEALKLEPSLLKELQAILGRWHDLENLKGLLGKHEFHKNPDAKLEMKAQREKAIPLIEPAFRSAQKQLLSREQTRK